VEQQRATGKTARRHTWPWFVLAAVVLAVLLAILWLSREIERTRKLRDQGVPRSEAETAGRFQTRRI
jgi:hypothetical protein